MKRVLFIFFLISFMSLSLAAQDRPITHDDLYNMKRISSPAVSPDGKLVAYVVTDYDKKENSSNSDIWLVPVAGGEPRQLTASPRGDSGPAWSPDGTQIAFVSTRGGSPQIYMISVAGGEARKISDISTGASGLTWSPDGTKIAFTSRVFPELEGDEANRKRLEKQANSKVKAKIIDRLLYRHWNEWTNDTRSHVFVIPADGGEARDITPGEYDSPPISLGGGQDYVFSNDSRTVCYVKNTDEMVAISTNNDLFTVDLSSGEHKRITRNRANDHSPSYSPDGKYIAYVAMERPGFEADKRVLTLYDLVSGSHDAITDDLDRSVGQFTWAPDSRTVYFTAQDEGQTSIYSVEIGTGAVKRLTEGTYNQSVNVTPDGRTLVFLRQEINRPTELFTMSTNGGEAKQITFTNRDLVSQLDMNPAEEFWFKGAKNTQIHSFIVKPPGFSPDRKYPMIYLVHGGPQGMWGDSFHYRWSAQMFASPGYVVVMVNPRGSTGYGQKLTDEITGDWGGKVFEDLKKGLKYAVDNYSYIDKDRIAAAGASYGGYMMNWFEAFNHELPYPVKCIVNHDGIFNTISMYYATEELWFVEWEFKGVPWDKKARKIYEKWSPSNYVENFNTPMLVIHSELDFRVPLNQGLEVFTALQRKGVPSKFLYFPDEDHWIHKPLNSELWYATIHEWIAEWTGK